MSIFDEFFHVFVAAVEVLYDVFLDEGVEFKIGLFFLDFVQFIFRFLCHIVKLSSESTGFNTVLKLRSHG